MSFSFDERTTRGPLGSSPIRKRRILEALAQGIAAVLSSSTASNYFTEQYGSNTRVIYEGAAKILAQILFDVMELKDDSRYLDLRTEFISAKLSSLLFDEDTLPKTDTDQELRELLVATLRGLIDGSTETSIKRTLEKISQAGQVEFAQTGEHSVSIFTSIYSITGEYYGHRHLVLNDGVGLTSTLAPLGFKWGDEFHQHAIIDGVIQPYTNAEGVSHTHEMEIGLPLDVLKLQNNLRKVFEVTKPAHILTDEISSVIGESISAPSEASVVGVGVISELDSSVLRYSAGIPFQEDMRKARIGAYEDIVVGYVEGKTVRLNNALIQTSDYISVDGVKKKVIGVTEETLRNQENPAVNWEAPRFGTSGQGSISALGYFTADAGNDTLSYLSEGEVIYIDGVAYFINYYSVGVIFPRTYLLTLDSTTEVAGELKEVRLLDYQWQTREVYFRNIEQINPSDSDSVVIRSSVRRTYKGLPLIADDITLISVVSSSGVALQGYSISEYQPISNTVLFNQVVPLGATLTFRVPFGDGDKFNFLSLNDTSFTLNSYRRRGQVETTSGRGPIPTTPQEVQAFLRGSRYPNGVDYGHLPVANLFSSESIEPRTSKTFSIKTHVGGEKSLNNQDQVLGRGFVLNAYTQPYSAPLDRVTDFATSNVIVRGGIVSPSQLGFIPDHVISVEVEGVEVDFTHTGNLVYLDVEDGTVATFTAISSTPLSAGQSWLKEADILSEGQVPFIFGKEFDPNEGDPTPDEIMADPLGLESDKLRTRIQKSETTLSGVAGEEVFYEDNVLSLDISGVAYSQYIPVATGEPTYLRAGLSLNSSISRLGVGSVLALGLSAPFRISQTSPVATEEVVPLISDEVTTSSLIESDSTDTVPVLSEEVDAVYTLLNLSPSDIIPLITEQTLTSLYLIPSTITETVPDLSDSTSLTIQNTSTSSETVPVASDDVAISLSIEIGDIVPNVTEDASPVLGLTLSESIPLASDTVTTSLELGDANVQDSVPLISDEFALASTLDPLEDVISNISEAVTTSYSMIPVVLSDTVPNMLEDVATEIDYAQLNLSDNIPLISDETSQTDTRDFSDSVPALAESTDASIAFTRDETDAIPALTEDVVVGSISISQNLSDTVPAISDGTSTTLSFDNLSFSDTVPSITELLTTSLNISGVFATDTYPVISDEVSASGLITSDFADSVPVSTDVVGTSLTLLPADISETLYPISDQVATSLGLYGVQGYDNVPVITDSVTGLVSGSTDLSDTVPNVTDVSTASLGYAGVSHSDTVPDVTDALTTSYVYEGFDNVDIVPDVTEEVTASLRLFGVSSYENVPAISDDLTTYYSHVPVSDTIPDTTEEVTTTYTLSSISESDSVPVPADTVSATLSYEAVSDTVPTISDAVTTSP